MGCEAGRCGIRTTETEFEEDREKMFATKFDRVLYILKKLKKRAEKYGDNQSINDIDWVLKAIQDKDLHEVELSDNKTNGMNDQEKMDLLANYTNIQKSIGLKNDLQKVNMIKEEKVKTDYPERYALFINKFKR